MTGSAAVPGFSRITRSHSGFMLSCAISLERRARFGFATAVVMMRLPALDSRSPPDTAGTGFAGMAVIPLGLLCLYVRRLRHLVPLCDLALDDPVEFPGRGPDGLEAVAQQERLDVLALNRLARFSADLRENGRRHFGRGQ